MNPWMITTFILLALLLLEVWNSHRYDNHMIELLQKELRILAEEIRKLR